MTDNRNSSAFYGDRQPYVVGILSPSTTLYIDRQIDNDNHRGPSPPPGDRQRRNTDSFQITSVTVQGHRRHDDPADDSCDDLDESHTDDLSSDFLDSSSRAEGYHSEDNGGICEDLSPCGPPIVFRDPNANSLVSGVTPTCFAGVVAGGVTMMTSKSESPVSAQVPIMNPLPDNWQRRFKVVKIVSSEPFRRGRWLCMDFKDPPAAHDPSAAPNGGTCTPPAIQVTGCESGEGGGALLTAAHDGALLRGDFAQVYEIPINQTFNGNFVVGSQQHMYGIILPPSEHHLQPVTLVQDLSLQTTDRNFNNLLNSHRILLENTTQEQSPFTLQQHPASIRRVQTIVNNNNSHHSPPSSVSANINNNNYNSSQAVPNHVVSNSTGKNSPDMFARTNSEDNRLIGGVGPVNVIVPPVPLQDYEMENPESFSSLANELSRASGLPRRSPPSNFGTNGLCCSPPLQSRILPPPKPVVIPPQTVAATIVPPVVAPPTAPTISTDIYSSQTAPEKIPPSEVGHEVDPSAGSAASAGGNTVAIDNKIEQAMDLVKSHLMFAVREEVEVLKEKITELLERISQLEHENDILRANASAETLKQLSNQSQKKNSGGGTTAKPQSVTTIPPST